MPVAGVAPAALPGWRGDDHAAALAAYAVTADLLPPGWPRPSAADAGDPRGFFERHFTARIPGTPPALITAYHEPELAGRASPEAGFAAPLFAPPDDLTPGTLWHDRRAIETGNLLAGRELVWLADPVEAFLAQVQGSVRVRLPGGTLRRFGHVARNGHPYRSIGAVLLARGGVAPEAMSAQAIRDWCRAHPGEVAELLRENPSFVFFGPVDLPEGAGPLGAMGRPVSAQRSLAVDPQHHPLGAPVWLEVEGPRALRRLMVAQDTGSAIKGAQRGDIFCGSGSGAGMVAGQFRDAGRLVTFYPREAAT